MGSENIELATLLVRLKAEFAQYDAELTRMLGKTDQSADKMAKSFDKVGTVVNRLGLALGAAAAAGIKSAMDWGNAVDDLSDKTGMSGEEASKFLVVAKRVNVGVDEANGIFAKFARSIATGTAEMQKASAEGKQADDVYTKLGVSTLDTNDKMRSMVDIFADVKDKLNDMEDGWQKTDIEMRIFGRSGATMHDMLHISNQEMDATIKKAQAMGLIISSEAAAATEKFTRDLNGLKGTMTSLGIMIANVEIPRLQGYINATNGVVKSIVEWKDANGPLADSIMNVAATVLELAAAYKILALAGLKIPAWMIPAGWSAGMAGGVAAGVGVALVGGGIAAHQYNTEQAKKAVDMGEALQFDPVTGLAVPTVSADSRFNRVRDTDYAPKPAKSDKKDDDYKGIGAGSGGSSGKSAFDKYSEETNALISKWEKMVQLDEMSKTEFASLVQGRVDGLKNVAASTDEVAKKDELEYALKARVFDLSQQLRQEAIEMADRQKVLGEITTQQYTDVIKKQLESAQTEKERKDLTFQYKQAMVETRAEAASMAQQQLSLGRITEEQYAQVLRQQALSAASEKEKLSYAMQYWQVMQNIWQSKEKAELRLDLMSYDFTAKEEELEALDKQLKELNKQFKEYQSGARKLTDEQLADLNANIDATKSRMRSVFRDYMRENKEMAQQTKEAWADALTDLFTGDLTPQALGKRLAKDYISNLIRSSMKVSTKGGGLLGSATKKTDVNPYAGVGMESDSGVASGGQDGTAAAAQDTASALIGLTGVIGGASGAVGGASAIIGAYNAVQTIINAVTKPAETVATITVTGAKTTEIAATALASSFLDKLAFAAFAAAQALQALAASGGGGWFSFLGMDTGGIVPAADVGMYTGSKRGPFPGGGRLIVAHPGELIFPKDVSDLVLDIAANGGGRGGNVYNVNINNAQNLNEDQLVSKMGRRIVNLNRGRR